MIDINEYKDFENVSNAKYEVALYDTKKLIVDSIKSGNLKEMSKYLKIYRELRKLYSKRREFGLKYGYESISKKEK